MKKIHLRVSSLVFGIFIGFFWLGLWWILSKKVDQPLLLPSPFTVLSRLFSMVQEGSFWFTALASLLRVLGGILVGNMVAVAVAALTAHSALAERFFRPLITIIKSTPVSSFIILAMLWIDRTILPIFISFLLVFPVVWSNVHTALRSFPKEYDELAKVFQISPLLRMQKMVIPWILPYYISSCESSLGLAWKAGIAAEALALPALSIGKQLFESKLYLETTDLFAWTIVVILLSLLFEKITGWLFRFSRIRTEKERKEKT